MNEDLRHWLTLLHAPALGAVNAHKLLQQFDYSASRSIAASTGSLHKLGLAQKSIDFIKQAEHPELEADLDWLDDAHHHIIPFDDPRYPAQLKQLVDAPILLFVRGDTDFLRQPQIAMVGSRTPTAAGKRSAEDFAAYLSQAGITITSGLATGIDGAAHRGALKGIGGTIALVAHGLDIVYPAQHGQLARQIVDNGAIVSEMPVGTTPSRGLFPRRNRLISGISLGTLVVEAALKSGSLITAKHALEQGKEIFAIPGSIHNPLSRGCHHLIRQGAKLVESANDILEELSITPAETTQGINQTKNEPDTPAVLDPDHQKLLKCLQFEPASIDELVSSSGFSAAEVASMLLILELEGTVVCDAGRYTRVA